MKNYIREEVVPRYAENFNRDIKGTEIKYYAKIHTTRKRSDNTENLHCHLVVSRKCSSNKKQLSPLTNHRETKKGPVKGGFDRKTFYVSCENGFDRAFNYNRQLKETFEYCNTMKYGNMKDRSKIGQALKPEKTNKQGISKSVAAGKGLSL
jgi:hypothetical protein